MKPELDMSEYLTQSGIDWRLLDAASACEAEKDWRAIYGVRFTRRLCPRFKKGAKAKIAYEQADCDRLVIVPFTSNVPGTAVNTRGRGQPEVAYECRCRPIPLGMYHNIEFFVSPHDFSWTMIYTHEDHGWPGGPYFIREEWF